MPNQENTSSNDELKNNSDIARVAFRPPPFWESNPDLWFGQIESQFFISGITDDKTKFHCVISALDAQVLVTVSDLITQPPEKDLYLTLKNRILNAYSQSETAKLKMLLQDLQLGDRKPSVLLHEMQSLANNKVSAEVLKSLWMQRLPISVQQILSVSDSSLENLSKLADKVYEVNSCVVVQSVAGISDPSSNINLEDLKAEISELRRELQQSKRRPRSYDRKNSHRKRSNRSWSHDRSMCWYHRRFAERAHKCVKPCSFQEN